MANALRTTATIATNFSTDPKTLRRFLRADQGLAMKVGKGKSWNKILTDLTPRDFADLRKRFNTWNAPVTPEADKAAKTPDTVVIDAKVLEAPKPTPPKEITKN
jgi:hypothetical protein